MTIEPRADATDIEHKIDLAPHRSWFDRETITVTTQGGKVTLTGSVETPGDRYVAAATAQAPQMRSRSRTTSSSPDRDRLASPPQGGRGGPVDNPRKSLILGARMLPLELGWQT